MRSAFPEISGLRRLIPSVLAGVFCLLTFAACNSSESSNISQTATPAGTAPPRTSFPMPPTAPPERANSSYSWTLLDNRRMRLSDYIGQVVVLDFWATYCPPCLEEAPHLVALQRRYGPQGLHVIGLNVGGPDDRYKVPEFVQQYNIQYTLGFPDPAMTSLFMSDDDRIPQTFVFDRKGQLVKHFVGYDSTMPSELERIIQTSLAAGAD